VYQQPTLYKFACHGHEAYIIPIFRSAGLTGSISSRYSRDYSRRFSTYSARPWKWFYSLYESSFGVREKEKHATLSRSWNTLVNFNDPIEGSGARTRLSSFSLAFHSALFSLHFAALQFRTCEDRDVSSCI